VARTQGELLGGVEIRAASPADCEAIKSFIAGLSVRARFFRFFTPASPPTPAVLRGLCGGGRTTDVLVATVGGAVIGHAMAADAVAPDGGQVTDIGLVVADRWQHRGLGSDLLGRLITRAAARGVSALEMDVLPENRPMLAIIFHRWADAKYEYDGGSVTVRVSLAGGAPAPDPGGHGTALRAA
jgi:acetyltransferase